jgi:thiol-disulfide isomerase/thioredoxin
MTRILLIAAAVLPLLLPSSALAAGSAPNSDPLFGAMLTDLTDRPVPLERFRGRPLVVNFWARWCPPCIDEIPDLIATRAKFKNQGIEVIGIAVEDSTALVREFAGQHKIDYPVLLSKDKGFAMMQALGNTAAGLPYTLVLDRHGKVIAKKLGRMSKSEMESAFAAATN